MYSLPNLHEHELQTLKDALRTAADEYSKQAILQFSMKAHFESQTRRTLDLVAKIEEETCDI